MQNQHNRSFWILLAGQSLSLLGTGMTSFAVMVWAFEKAGTATALSLIGFFACITYVFTSPFAGPLVDRLDRRKVMFFSDLGAGLMTAVLLILNHNGHLQIWHLYLVQGITGIFSAFQQPAFSAALSLIVPRDQYTRANGMLGLAKSSATLLAPAAAGALFATVGLNAIMLVDLTTMALALGGLLFVRIPLPPKSGEGSAIKPGWRHQLAFGFRYIFSRPGLRGILSIHFLINTFATLTYFAVLSPMILARSGDEVALSVVRTVMGIGGVAGGLVISLWGGPKRKAFLYTASTAVSFLVCDLFMGASRSTLGWSAAGFLSELTIPFIVAPYYSLWQERVPTDVQGRVFSARDMVGAAPQPLGYLFGGLLADRLFEPAMAAGGALAGPFGWLVGTGHGAGMGLMFACTSLLGCLTGVLGLLSPAIQALDDAEPAAPAVESLAPAD